MIRRLKLDFKEFKWILIFFIICCILIIYFAPYKASIPKIEMYILNIYSVLYLSMNSLIINLFMKKFHDDITGYIFKLLVGNKKGYIKIFIQYYILILILTLLVLFFILKKAGILTIYPFVYSTFQLLFLSVFSLVFLKKFKDIISSVIALLVYLAIIILIKFRLTDFISYLVNDLKSYINFRPLFLVQLLLLNLLVIYIAFSSSNSKEKI